MARKATKDTQVNVRLSDSLIVRLDEMVARQNAKRSTVYTRSDAIRNAIRSHIDRQEDIIGSRRHFRNQFKATTDIITWALLVIIFILADGFSVLILELVVNIDNVENHYGKEKADRIRQRFSAQGMMGEAIANVREYGMLARSNLALLALNMEQGTDS